MPEHLTLDEALDAVEEMCGEAELTALKPDGCHPTELSEFASTVYRIIHAHRGECQNKHEDWLLKKHEKA